MPSRHFYVLLHLKVDITDSQFAKRRKTKELKESVCDDEAAEQQ